MLQRGAARGPDGTRDVKLIVAQRLKCFRAEFEREGVEAFAYMNDTTLGLMGVTANAVRAIPSLGARLVAFISLSTLLNPWRYLRKGRLRSTSESSKEGEWQGLSSLPVPNSTS